MSTQSKPLGLRQQMAQAKDLPELHGLCGLAATFKDASNHTRQRWANTAKRREKALNGK